METLLAIGIFVVAGLIVVLIAELYIYLKESNDPFENRSDAEARSDKAEPHDN